MAVLIPKADPLAGWDSMPLGHARIGYLNLLTGAATVDAAKALTPNTWERWRPPSGALSVKFQMAVGASVDYFAIAAHDLTGETLVIKYATSIGGSLASWLSIRPVSNSPIMVLMPTITMAEIEISGTLTTAREIGVVHVGKALQMQRPIYGGHSPIDLNAKVDYQSVMSDSGQFLGRNIVRKGSDTNFNWKHLDPDWYRQRFQPFVESAKTKPFFIKWRPDLYDVAAYGYTNGDLSPSNMGGGHNLMQVAMQVRAHDDV